MSYDVFIELPKPLRNKPKRGEYPPQALERLEQIVQALQRIDPEVEIEREDVLVEGRSRILGHVVADPNRLSLRYTSAFGYHGMLQAMQRALAELEPLGFEGHDPQIGGRIHYFAERAPFMRQFRSQFLCPDDEFELFAQGTEPPAWRRWRELTEKFEQRYIPANFPWQPDVPDWQVLRDMETAPLALLLQRLIEHNDRLIEKLELREFLQQACLRGWATQRRGNGEWLPFNDWFPQGTSLGQEMDVMQWLIGRGWPPVIFPQPQQLRIVVDANRSDDVQACYLRSKDMHRELWKAAKEMPGCTLGCRVWCDYVEYTEIDCDDPDVALAQLLPILQRHNDLPIQIRRRYGWHGAKEVESSLPD